MADYSKLDKSELLQIIERQEKELKAKKYGLVWDAEREPEQVVLDCAYHLPILKRLKTKEIRTDLSEDNIIIEGDNYHALSVLNYTHKGKIDVIYIDPPYNTGNKDFKYNDKYVDKEDSYRHSKWLNFMEKRLNLAYRLLKKTGVIFISIDDNESAQLKLLCDSIFGEKNFVACLPTVMNLKGNNDEFGFAGTHEYTMVYSKDITKCVFQKFSVNEEELQSWEQDDIGYFKKGANLKSTGVNAPRNKRPNLFYPIFINSEKKVYVTEDNQPLTATDVKILPITNGQEMSWRWQKSKIKNEPYNIIVTGTPKKYSVYKKQRPELGDLPSKKPKSLFYKPEYSSGNGTSQLKNIFGGKIFNNPKPLGLIYDIILLGTADDSLILDFMAGSGTTGHAVLELNKEDGGNRKFILCTNNENKICEEVTYPRLKKVIKGYKKASNGEAVEGLSGNLQYLKTGLLKKSNNRDQLRLDLTRKCTEMLCLKENIFNFETEGDDYKIFSSNSKDRYLCIYYNAINETFEEFYEKISALRGKKVVYMFSMNMEADKSIFRGISDLTLEAIPHKILDVYKQLVKLNIPINPNMIFADLKKAKAKLFEEKEKDDAARILRVVLEKLIQKIAQSNQINILTDNGKEEKVSRLCDKLLNSFVFTKIEWEESKLNLAIGNEAAHGNYDEYNIKQVEKFYRNIQDLLSKHNIEE